MKKVIKKETPLGVFRALRRATKAMRLGWAPPFKKGGRKLQHYVCEVFLPHNTVAGKKLCHPLTGSQNPHCESFWGVGGLLVKAPHIASPTRLPPRPSRKKRNRRVTIPLVGSQNPCFESFWGFWGAFWWRFGGVLTVK